MSTDCTPAPAPRGPGARLRRGGLDRAGVLLSGLCLVHCLAGLGLVGVLGLGGGVLLAPQWHEAGLALALVIGALGLGLGFVRHRDGVTLALGMAGLGLMALALAVGHGAREAILTIAGVSLVASAHIRNLRRAH